MGATADTRAAVRAELRERRAMLDERSREVDPRLGARVEMGAIRGREHVTVTGTVTWARPWGDSVHVTLDGTGTVWPYRVPCPLRAEFGSWGAAYGM